MKTEAAKTAKLIREELKKAFPALKFSVVSNNYAGGESVAIEYTHNLEIEKVTSLIAKYQYGRFEGMTDSYEYNNVKDHPQVRFIFVRKYKEQQQCKNK